MSEAGFECPKCPYTNPTKKYLTEHIKIKHPEITSHPYPLLKCESCEYETKKSSRLKAHLKTHQPKDLSCTYHSCTKVFKHQSSLEEHEHKVHHAAPRQDFHCCDRTTAEGSACQQKFRTRSKLTEHIQRVHEKKRDSKCQNCAKTFSTKGDLQKHQKRKICGKKLQKASEVISYSCHLKDTDYGTFQCHDTFTSLDALLCHRDEKHSAARSRIGTEYDRNPVESCTSMHEPFPQPEPTTVYPCPLCSAVEHLVDKHKEEWIQWQALVKRHGGAYCFFQVPAPLHHSPSAPPLSKAELLRVISAMPEETTFKAVHIRNRVQFTIEPLACSSTAA